MNGKLRLLIVEDEESILQGLVDVFVFHGYEVEAARDGETGLRRALEDNFDLILLDVMLPERDGFQVCEAIRAEDREQPIILLTAKTSEEDIITGLSLGADDYVAKPFSVAALVLRVEAVLRRSRKVIEAGHSLQIGDRVVIDSRNLTGQFADGEVLPFTRREVDLLMYLERHKDRPVPRGELLLEVWGYKKGSTIETRTVDIHIAKLRKKLEVDPKAPEFLVTVRGEGYRLLMSELG